MTPHAVPRRTPPASNRQHEGELVKQLTTVQGFAVATVLSAVLWVALIVAGYVVSGWVTR